MGADRAALEPRFEPLEMKSPASRGTLVGADRAALEPRFEPLEMKSPASRGTLVGAEGLEPPTTSV